ncbi:type II toxin-antitoxin system prevent-host-death family antitoxin [Corynebacterium sp. TA-R-1]|uniref:Antitoxin n=1 Tax=Corynebacterium stercoris TaxID=2943490 RepID=A0ABT1FYY6_9CORY|nr:type II toxin-antitoxin system prevent-host-death family antitoxin [Corynebacterium stercoris]MCP1386979.1 type II toxin-antitoxin system prevent-host-death family antitoxin [Corynebacterium stercoris]
MSEVEKALSAVLEGREVSMRELNQQTRSVIDRVAKAGETVTITDRGNPIAVIRPVGQKTGIDRLEALGLIARRADPAPFDWEAFHESLPPMRDLGMSLADYLEEERGDHRIDEAIARADT